MTERFVGYIKNSENGKLKIRKRKTGGAIMYEELYQRIPDLDAYMERIQMQREEVCNEDYLDRLVFAHQCAIPFENLDVRKGKSIELGIEHLFDKIVRKRRGGYCFEMNALFCQFLVDCGFKAYGCRSRIVRGKDFVPPVLHRGTLVELEDGLYYCDVGYGGPQPGGSIKVEDGAVKDVAGQTYRITKTDQYWWTMSRAVKTGWEDIMQFTTMPQVNVDFIAINAYCSMHPDSVFVQKTLLNRRLPNGSIALTDRVFTKFVNGEHIEEVIADQGRYVEVIETEFGIPDAENLI